MPSQANRRIPIRLVLLALSAFLVSKAQAATYIVNNLADTGTGGCTASGVGDGCTLREAVAAAESDTGADDIVFSTSGTITLTSSVPISKDLTISGPNSALIVSGNYSSPGFAITGGRVKFSNFSLTNFSGYNAPGAVNMSGGDLTLNGMTLSDNRMSGGGYPPYPAGPRSGAVNITGGNVLMTNCTLTRNSGVFGLSYSNTSISGGAGAIQLTGGTLTAVNCTIASNSGGSGGPSFNGVPVNGGAGGISQSGTATLNLINTIVAQNFPGAGSFDLYGGPSGSSGATNVSGTINTNVSNILNGSGVVNAVSANGGPTSTCSLTAASVARDAGDNSQVAAYGLSVDQRGSARISGSAVDIGAYEDGPDPGSLVVNTLIDNSTNIDHKNSLREALAYANTLANPGTISFSVAGTITLGSDLPVITSPVSIAGPSGGITVDGAGSYSAFNVVLPAAVGDFEYSNFTVSNCRGSSGSLPSAGAVQVTCAGTATLRGMTFNGNVGGQSTSSGVGGGAGAVGILTATVHLYQSTLTGNTGGTSPSGSVISGPGAIGLSGFTGAKAQVMHCTVSGNVGGSGVGGIGNDNGFVLLANSIVAGNNTASDSSNISGVYSRDGGNVLYGDPRLAALAANGGPTQTMALQNDSPAVNNGSDAIANSLGFTNDQRGTGYGLFKMGHVDIGAYELQTNNGPGGVDAAVELWVGDNTSTKLGVTGAVGTLTYSIIDGVLPPGLTLDPGTGYVTGVPTQIGNYKIIYGISGGQTYNAATVKFTVYPAASLVVTTLDDTNDPADGYTSLREAIASALFHAGADTITFQPDLEGTINLNSALPVLDSISIQGPGADKLTVRRGSSNSFRIFSIASGATAALSGLTIRDGRVDNTTDLSRGGGVYTLGKVTITACRITGNVAENTKSSEFKGGAGIFADSSANLTVIDSTLDGNIVTGIAYDGYSCGGAIYSVAPTTLRQCTISGNSAVSYGGGVYLQGYSQYIQNCTVVGNSVGNYGTSYGGGLYFRTSATITNTISVGNNSSDVYSDFSTFASGGYNIYGVSKNFTADATDQTGATSLQVFGTNSPTITSTLGGTTPVLMLPETSIAIDKGDPAYNLSNGPYDQRGAGYPRKRGPRIDVGAIEGRGPKGPPTISNATFTGRVGQPFSGQIVAAPQDDDPLTYSVAAGDLPAGLTLDPATGLISGTATETHRGIITVTVADGDFSATAELTLNISEAQSLVVTTLTDVEDEWDNLTSLREAINYADGTPARREITFAVSGTIQQKSPYADIQKNLDITGPNAGITIDFGTEPHQPFRVYKGGNFTLKNFTLKHCFTGVLSGGGNVTLWNCTISDGQTAASIYGGGAMKLYNCTLIGNTAQYGALFLSYAGVPTTSITAVHCTIVNNHGLYNTPGGIENYGGVLTISNCIVAGNTSTDPTIPNVRGEITQVGANFIGSDARLALLADNGGATQTCLPLDDSPALNAGDDSVPAANGLDYDQRGAGFPRIFGAHPDLGAVELQRDPISHAAPTLALNQPAEGATVQRSAFVPGYITGTASDDGYIKSINLSIRRVRQSGTQYWDGTNWVAYSEAEFPAALPGPYLKDTTFQWTTGFPPVSQLDDGPYIVTATARDNLDKPTSLERQFTILEDLAPPQITIDKPQMFATIKVNLFKPGYVTGLATDDESVTGVTFQLRRPRNGVDYYWDGSDWTTSSSARVPATVTAPNTRSTTFSWVDSFPTTDKLDSGTYVVQATATDNFGKTQLASRTFDIDTDLVGPLVAFTSPATNAKILAKDFVAGTVAGTATDQSGVNLVFVKLFRTLDGVKQYWAGAVWTTNPVFVQVAIDSQGSQTTAWRVNLLPPPSQLTPGAYSVQAYATDVLGQVGTAVTRNFNIAADLTPPILTISNPAVNAVMLPEAFVSGGLNGTATDDSSVTSVAVKFYRTNSGVKEYWNGSAFGTASVAVNATLGSGTWSLPLPDAGLLASGPYGVSVTARDPSGNSATATRSFTILGDVTPPTGSISHPAVNSNLLPSNFAASVVDGTAADNTSVASVSVKLFRTISGAKQFWTGTAWTADSVAASANVTGLGTANTSWVLSPLPAASDLATGGYGVQSQIKDGFGNTTIVTCPFNIVADATPPLVTIASPTASQKIQASAFTETTVRGTATDTGGAVASVSLKLYRTVSGVKYFWNGSSFGTASVSAPVAVTGLGTESATWNLNPAPTSSDLVAGPYSVQASAKDASGNTSTLVTRNFTVETPVASLTGSSSHGF